MAKRDPIKTQRNKEIENLTQKIKKLQPDVLKATGYPSDSSLNGTYGGKHDEYIDIKNEVIDTPEQFRSLYFQGFSRKLDSLGIYAKFDNPYFDAFTNYRDHKVVREWLELFLTRTFLRNYEALTKYRPTVEESVIWIGQENASYGILITPRLKSGEWENDKSEIRHFKPNYWTIGHILETGLVIPGVNEKIEFTDLEQYLSFFKNTLVRNSGSKHEREIATRYCDFVRTSEEPNTIPLLIPEFRYGGIEKKHKYRLDFCVINPYNLSKIGFELSPWSTHGALKGTKGKKQKEINAEAQKNFENEMKKLKSYFRKFGITILVYTDSDLKDYDAIFKSVADYLNVKNSPKQLELQSIGDLLSFDAPSSV